MPIEELSGPSLAADETYRVGTVTVVRQRIFNTDDPTEANALFRLANRWHIDTREDVVRALVLFAEGDAVTAGRLAESERLLRGKRFLYDARIVANRLCDDEVDVALVTRDVWSLLPALGATRTGGEQGFEVGASEINLLGTGASLDIEAFDDLDRQGVSIGFANPNLRNSRVGLQLRYEDTDDGEAWFASIGQPFYAFDATRAWDARMQESRTTRRLYQAGRATAAFVFRQRFAQISRGWSKGLVDGFANRLSVGFTMDEQRIDLLEGKPGDLRDRTFAYPWIAFDRVEDDYAKATNIDRVQTTEDVFLGTQSNALLGYSPRGDGYLIASAAFRNGWRGGNGDVLRYGAQASGYWNMAAQRAENVLASAWVRYRHRHTPRLALHVDAEATVADQLDADQQVLAGGDSGLRAYPNRYQAGSRSFRVTAEERLYTDLHLFRVLRVAGAAFIDAGRAWSSKRDNDLLANAGVGLRFESTRTDRSLVYHIDLAFPLVAAPDVRGAELTLTSKRSL